MTPKVRIAAGIILIVVAPLVSFLLILAPIKGFFFLVFLVPGAIVLYESSSSSSDWLKRGEGKRCMQPAPRKAGDLMEWEHLGGGTLPLKKVT